MLLQKIIGALLFLSLSLPHLALAQDTQDTQSQNFILTYSRIYVDDLEPVVASLETLAAKDAEKVCSGTATKLSETSHLRLGPWSAYTILNLTFEFKCDSL